MAVMHYTRWIIHSPVRQQLAMLLKYCQISDVTVKGEVYGGYTAEGTTSNDATGNAVTIESGTIEKTVYGGYTADGTASKNTVTINGGTVGVADSTESSDTVFGGYSASGEAVSNILTVSGGDLIGHVTSGYGKTGASDNTLTMTGGSSTKRLLVTPRQGMRSIILLYSAEVRPLSRWQRRVGAAPRGIRSPLPAEIRGQSLAVPG